MPRLTHRGGEVFSLSRERTDYEGAVSQRYHVEAGVRYGARFETCHGVRMGLDGEALAQVRAQIGAHLALLEAEAKAGLAAGLSIEAQLSPQVFDQFGLTAAFRAYAEAAIAARLQIGLRTEFLVERVEGELGEGLPAKLFEALARRLTINAGVWGKASFAAAAEGYLIARGRLLGEDPGFEIGLGGGAAFKAGAGFEFYAKIGFDDQLGRFFDEAAGLLSDTLVDVVEDPAGASDAPPPGTSAPAAPRRSWIGLLRVVCRVSLRAGFALGQQAESASLRASVLADQLVDLTAQELQHYVIERITAFGLGWLRAALPDDDLPLPDPGALGRIRTLDDLARVTGPLLPWLAEAPPQVVDRVRRPLACVWCALVTVDERGSTALPDAPGLVRDEVGAVLSTEPLRLTRGTALRYLAAIGLEPRVRQTLPDVAVVLDQLDAALDTAAPRQGLDTLGVAILLAEDAESNWRSTLYPAIRGFLATSVDRFVAEDLLGEAKRSLPADDPRRLMLDEVVEPALAGLARLLLARLDQMVRGKDADPEAFRQLLGIIAYRMVASSVVVLVKVLLDHVLDELHGGFDTLRHDIRRGALDRLYRDGWRQLPQQVRELVPAPAPSPAIRDLAHDLAVAGREAFGPEIWTPQRRQALHASTRELLYSFSFEDVAELDEKLAELDDCRFVPAPDGLRDLTQTLLTIGDDQMGVVLHHVTPAWLRFYEQTMWAALQQFVALATRAVETAVALLTDHERREDLAREGVRALVQAVATVSGRTRELEARIAREATALVTEAVGAVKQRMLSKVPAPLRGPASEAFDRRMAGPLRGALEDLGLGSLDVTSRDPVRDLRGVLARSVDGRLAARAVPTAVPGASLLRSELVDVVVDAMVPDAVEQLARQLGERIDERIRTLAALEGQRRALAQIEEQVRELVPEVEDLFEVRSDRGALDVDIHAPSGDATHTESMPLRVTVRGGRRSFVESRLGDGTLRRRLQVLVNGTELHLPQGAWRFDASRSVLVLDRSVHRAEGRFTPGLNLVEVRVTDGRPGAARTARATRMVRFDLAHSHVQAPPPAVASPRDTVSVRGRLGAGSLRAHHRRSPLPQPVGLRRLVAAAQGGR